MNEIRTSEVCGSCPKKQRNCRKKEESKIEEKFYRLAPHLLVGSLSIADMLLGLTVMPVYIIQVRKY